MTHRYGIAALIGLASLAAAPQVQAHPHVFVDTSIAFVMEEPGALQALDITWRFDPMESLYILAAQGITPSVEGTLDAEARAKLSESYADWHPAFNGFARLSLGGAQVDLSAPRDVEADLVDGQLWIRFSRALPAPTSLHSQANAEVAVYEDTYFYAVTVGEQPTITGAGGDCAATLTPFDPDTQELVIIQTTLFELGREETPDIEGVGALFADRITLTCG